jgi:hypothetical protein
MIYLTKLILVKKPIQKRQFLRVILRLGIMEIVRLGSESCPMQALPIATLKLQCRLRHKER